MNLQLRRRQKIALVAIFALGFFVTIIQIIRIFTVKNLKTYTDSQPIVLWSTIEVSLGVCFCPCIGLCMVIGLGCANGSRLFQLVYQLTRPSSVLSLRLSPLRISIAIRNPNRIPTPLQPAAVHRRTRIKADTRGAKPRISTLSPATPTQVRTSIPAIMAWRFWTTGRRFTGKGVGIRPRSCRWL